MSTQRNWRWWHSAILLLIVVGVLAAGEVSPNQRVTWVVCLVLLALFAVIAGQGVTGYWWGVGIDDRNKVSLSRVQMIAWTIIVTSGFLAAALSNIKLGHADPLDIDIPEQLLWLMGISTTSLVGSPLISNSRKSDVMMTKRSAAQARWIDMFMGEERSDATTMDLAKVQMFFITVVVLIAYGIAMGMRLSDGGSITALPALDGSIVGLLAISHFGYLTNKGIPKAGSAPPEDGPQA